MCSCHMFTIKVNPSTSIGIGSVIDHITALPVEKPVSHLPDFNNLTKSIFGFGLTIFKVSYSKSFHCKEFKRLTIFG